MIALNEIIKNKDYFSNKYKLMGKNCNLEKIIKLEKKFIALDQRKNEKRALCNKLCAQMADLINKNNDTEQLIKEINFLDKQLMVDERKSTHAMKKINKLLAKLPNPALNNNILNISLKTTPNKNFSEKTLKLELAKIAENNQISNTQIKSIKSLKNRVLQKENLPKFLLHNRKINNEEITILMSDSPEPVFEQITSLLKNNACIVIDKSIKYLDKISSREILSKLYNNTEVLIQHIGEYISRDINLKFYDKQTDMTHFVNIIKIKIKCHG